MLETLDEALRTSKSVNISCPHCGRFSRHQVPDAKAALEAARFMVENSIGKPGTASGETDMERITFVRVNVGCSDDIEPAVAAALKEAKAK